MPATQLPQPPRPVLDGLCYVSHLNPFRGGEVGDGAGELEDAVKGAGRKLELLGSLTEQAAGAVIQSANFLDLSCAHIGVACKGSAFEAGKLEAPGFLYSLPVLPGGLRVFRFHEFLVVDSGDFDEHVYSVKQGAADAFLVPGNEARGAGAFSD